MSRFLIRLSAHSKAISILTILAVVLFQLFWLANNFNQLQRQLVAEVEKATKEQLSGMQLIKVINVLGTTGVIGHKLDIAVLINRMIDSTRVSAALPQKIDERKGKMIQSRMEDEQGLDSLVYLALASNTSLSPEDLVVYHYAAGKATVYPRGHSVQESGNTKKFRSAFIDDGYTQVHIRRLTQLTLGRMMPLLGTSLLYLLLFLLTIFVLLKTVALYKSLLESRSNFTKNMTHELKLPIATSLIAIDAIGRYDVLSEREEAERYLSMIKSGLLSISSIVNSVLEHTRVESEEIRMHPEPLSLHRLLDEVTGALQLQIVRAGAVIDLSGIPRSAFIYGDHKAMLHVFSNLIDNALKYATEPPIVRISYQGGGKYDIVQVADNGIGIPAGHIRDVFRSYFRVAQTEPRLQAVKGYGLGLNFVAGVVRAHKGTINILKSNAAGTLLEVRLPRKNV